MKGDREATAADRDRRRTAELDIWAEYVVEVLLQSWDLAAAAYICRRAAAVCNDREGVTAPQRERTYTEHGGARVWLGSK